MAKVTKQQLQNTLNQNSAANNTWANNMLDSYLHQDDPVSSVGSIPMSAVEGLLDHIAECVTSDNLWEAMENGGLPVETITNCTTGWIYKDDLCGIMYEQGLPARAVVDAINFGEGRERIPFIKENETIGEMSHFRDVFGYMGAYNFGNALKMISDKIMV